MTGNSLDKSIDDLYREEKKRQDTQDFLRQGSRRGCENGCDERIDNQQRTITELRAENERLKIQKADAERESADWKARFETAQSELDGARAKMRLIHRNPHHTHYDANWDGGRREEFGY